MNWRAVAAWVAAGAVVGASGGFALGWLLHRASWPRAVLPMELAAWGLGCGAVAGVVFVAVQRLACSQPGAAPRTWARQATLAFGAGLAGTAAVMGAAAWGWRAAHGAGVLDAFLDWQVVNAQRQAMVLAAWEVKDPAAAFGLLVGALTWWRRDWPRTWKLALPTFALVALGAAAMAAAWPVARTMQPANHACTTDEASVLALMRKVADWQLAHPRRGVTDWHNCHLHAGLLALSRVAGDTRYRDELLRRFDAVGWQLGPAGRLADDQCSGSVYLELMPEGVNPGALAAVRRPFDALLASPRPGREEWHWCDALFMAPPVLARLAAVTQEHRYLELLDALYWDTASQLYEAREALFYRDARFISHREANGRPVFWSRGNAWVLAGLARTLPHLPAQGPIRTRYEALFREMAKAVARTQQPDGFWRASLLHPDGYPGGESSGTALFAFALAWGVNAGLLPRDEYLPVVSRAWQALCGAVTAQGRLGWVQGEDIQPSRPRRFDWDTYASGAMLMAGAEWIAVERSK